MVLIFIAGLVGLWIGAELTIRGAISIAYRLKLSEAFVGLTILSLGTSLPELFISLTGGMEQLLIGTPVAPLVIGNIVGASMNQMTFVLGFSGLIHVLKTSEKQVVSSGFLMITAAVLVWLVIADGAISRPEAAVLLLGYGLYLLKVRKNAHEVAKKRHLLVKKTLKLPVAWLTVAMGLSILLLSSHTVLTQAIPLAGMLGLSQALVGIVLISFGTSLPEMIVSLTASFKGADGMSVGNAIGSVITNLLLVLGSGSMIAQWNVPTKVVLYDLPIITVVGVIVFIFLLTRRQFNRLESLVMLAIYWTYLLFRIMA